jgi:ethanolamine utilization cobalamin adenosyltransferase
VSILHLIAEQSSDGARLESSIVFSLTARLGAKNKHQLGFQAFITVNYEMLSNKEIEFATSKNKEQRDLQAILSFREAISSPD